jgi:hypothetical protein
LAIRSSAVLICSVQLEVAAFVLADLRHRK